MDTPPFPPPDITVALVRRLIASQFPQWSDLPITPAEPQGWDNRTFRLGETLSARLPSAAGYVAQVEKEHRWLPYLSARLPLPIPAPIALGRPGDGYPFPWSIYGWLDGEPAGVARPDSPTIFAADLAAFLRALHAVEPGDGPAPGPHCFFRGGALSTYDRETRECVAQLSGEIDVESALALWRNALSSSWTRAPVWFHGDIAVNNLLARGDRLVGVIDFGCAGVGDPACDLVIAWTLFFGESRERFQASLPEIDPDTWTRAQGWALWKALLVLRESRGHDPFKADSARAILRELVVK